MDNITRETSHGALGNTSRARNEMEEEHDQIVRVDGNIFGWS